jgi:hypothetical protein
MGKPSARPPRENDLEPEIRDARARGLRRRREEAYAVAASYDGELNRIEVDLSNGFHFSLPPSLLPQLDEASSGQLRSIEIDPSGYGLRWPELDADYDLAGLVQVALGAKRWLSVRELGRLGGQSRSSAKRSASATNGLKGGRPRKKPRR